MGFSEDDYLTMTKRDKIARRIFHYLARLMKVGGHIKGMPFGYFPKRNGVHGSAGY